MQDTSDISVAIYHKIGARTLNTVRLIISYTNDNIDSIVAGDAPNNEKLSELKSQFEKMLTQIKMLQVIMQGATITNDPKLQKYIDLIKNAEDLKDKIHKNIKVLEAI